MNKAANINQSRGAGSLASMLNKGKKGAERRYRLANEPILRILTQEICTRNGGAVALSKDDVISSQYIIQQMAYNYANLLRATTESMSYTFTSKDMTLFLPINCSPIWQNNFYVAPIEMAMQYYGIESLEDRDIDVDERILLEKLEALSYIECLTLIDICEQFWRNQRPVSFEDNLKYLNLKLA
jgi:hypothetical protein